MSYRKREDMELASEAELLLENEKIEKEYNGKIYTIIAMKMKDYRNDKGYSHLSIEFTVLHEGKKVVEEFKYDSGYPPIGVTLKDNVIPRIRGSSGREMVFLGKDSLGLEVSQITAPPSVVELSETWFGMIVGCFKESNTGED